jgi:ribonuclease P protein component
LNYKQTFKKEERIFLQKEIDLLFAEGASFIAYPLRVVYVKKEPSSGVRSSILVSVSKKKFKQAVKRNRIKRLIREAYRRNKNPFLKFLEEKETGVLIAFLFLNNELCRYEEIEAAMTKSLNLLKEKLQ